MIFEQSDGRSAMGMRRLFLGFGRQVVANDAPGHRTGDGMVTGDMPGHSAGHGTLDATRRQARLAEGEQENRQDDDRKTFHGRYPRRAGAPKVTASGLTGA